MENGKKAHFQWDKIINTVVLVSPLMMVTSHGLSLLTIWHYVSYLQEHMIMDSSTKHGTSCSSCYIPGYYSILRISYHTTMSHSLWLATALWNHTTVPPHVIIGLHKHGLLIVFDRLYEHQTAIVLPHASSSFFEHLLISSWIQYGFHMLHQGACNSNIHMSIIICLNCYKLICDRMTWWIWTLNR